MIYVLEGPDGVGKTTLAHAIQEKTKGHILHCSFNKNWDIKEYLQEVMDVAKKLNKYQDVIIDRWVPSEWVYGHVFRGGPAFDVDKFLKDYVFDDEIQWIMCKHPEAVANHFKNREVRHEMFEDMTDVVANFSLFEIDRPEMGWIDYDYSKTLRKDWIEKNIKSRGE